MHILIYIILSFAAYVFINNSYANEIENISTGEEINTQDSIISDNRQSEPLIDNEDKNSNIVEDNPPIPNLERFIVTLEINHDNTNIVSTILKNHLNHLLIPAEDIKDLNISTEYLNNGSVYLENEHYIDLDLLPGTKYYLNIENLVLIINFNVEGMELQNLDGVEKQKVIFSQATSGAVVDYDVSLIQGNDSRYIAGIQGLNYFTSNNGIFNNNVFIKRDLSKHNLQASTKPNQLVRLESNWTFDKVDSMARWRIGDSITKPSDWSGSTRFVGLQYSTNFATRPDLITYPLLDFAGKAELPSTIDIYANSLQVYHNELRTGNFNINQLPVNTGKGEMIVKTTDITGKVKTFILPYYLSPILLKKGLTDFSYEAGWQRMGYGISSNKYKDFLFSSDYSKGMNDNWTLSGHMEGKLNKASLGVSSYFNVHGMGIISGSLATNLVAKSPGQRVLVGYSYSGDQFNFNINSTFNYKKFIDIYNDTAGISGHSYQISFGYTNNLLGSFYTNYTSTPIYDSNNKLKKLQLMSVTYEKNITKRSLMRVNIGTSIQEKKRDSFANISFNINLDNKFISAGSNYQNKVRRDQISISSSNNINWGYKAHLVKEPSSVGYDIELSRKGSIVNSTLYLFDYGNNPSQQFNIYGSVVAMDKDIYFTKSVDTSLVLVKTGKLADIPVYNNNQYIGNTDKHGKILVPNVTPYVPSEIRLDEKKVPLDTKFSNLALKVTPPWNSGVILNFDTYKVKSLEMKIVDTAGRELPLNTSITIDGIGDEVLVGYNGKVYIEDIKDLEVLIGKEVCEIGKCCTFEAVIDKTDKNSILDLGTVICD